SQFCSVSRLTQNDSWEPPAGTVIVRASRLYVRLAIWDSANWVPECGVAIGVYRSGSSASQNLIPFIWYACRLNCPTVAVARYEAIGSRACQTQVLQPPWVRLLSRTPLETASS